MRRIVAKLINIAVDTETAWNVPFIATTTNTRLKSKLYVIKNEEDYLRLKYICESKKYRKIFHNAVYDIYCLSRIGIKVRGEVECTMVMASILNENFEVKSLKGLAKIYLHEECKEEQELSKLKAKLKRQAKKEGKIFTYDMFPPEILYPYALKDTEYTMQLYYLFKEPIKKYYKIYAMEKKLIPIVVKMIKNGFTIDRKFLKKIIKHYNRMMHRVKSKMIEIVEENGIEILKRKKNGPFFKEYSLRYGRKKAYSRVFAFAEKNKYEVKRILINKKTGKVRAQFIEQFNPNSALHLDTILRALEVPIKEETKEGLVATDNLVLTEHKDNPFIAQLLLHKFYSKQMSSYYDPIYNEDTTDEDPVAHFIFYQSGAKSGRFSAKRIQTIPRKDQGKYEQERYVRRIFVPRPGYRFLFIDYDQVEFRLFAHFSGSRRLLKAFEDGLDPHIKTAMDIWGDHIGEMEGDELKYWRKKAKSINFGIIYGMGNKLLAKSLGLPMREANEALARYHSIYPVKEYMRSVTREINQKGHLRVIYDSDRMDFYRDYRVPLDKSYKGANLLCQGSSAYIMKMGMIRCSKLIKRKQYDINMIGTLHDELIFEVSLEEDLSKVTKALIKCMEDRTTFKIPILASADTSDKSWRDAEKYDPYKEAA